MRYFVIERLYEVNGISREAADSLGAIIEGSRFHTYYHDYIEKMWQDRLKGSSFYGSKYLIERGFLTERGLERIKIMCNSNEQDIKDMGFSIYEGIWEQARPFLSPNQKLLCQGQQEKCQSVIQEKIS